MFEDEAGFGRINKPKRCWCRKGTRGDTFACLTCCNPTGEVLRISRSFRKTGTNCRNLKTLISCKYRSGNADDLTNRGIRTALAGNGARRLGCNLSVTIAQEQLSFGLGGIN